MIPVAIIFASFGYFSIFMEFCSFYLLKLSRVELAKFFPHAHAFTQIPYNKKASAKNERQEFRQQLSPRRAQLQTSAELVGQDKTTLG